ncbi:MAG TPA: hypothetical protein VHR86_00590, partial [Armatimonadota bacterium]|nr:hypothetical protein [Armatimonadota bacterium]
AHGIVCAFDRGEAFEGNCSALVTNRSPFYQDPAGWKQERSAPAPGSNLKLEGCLQTEGVQGTAYLRLECWGRRPAGAGEAAGEEVMLASANSIPASGSASWRPATVALRVPEGATRVVAACVLAGRGNAWFDALRLAAW